MNPDAWLYDSVTIKSNGRKIESETAKVEQQKHWPNERPLFTAETIVEQLEDWLTDLEDNGMSAQCSLRVEMKVKDEMGLLEDENKDDKDGDAVSE